MSHVRVYADCTVSSPVATIHGTRIAPQKSADEQLMVHPGLLWVNDYDNFTCLRLRRRPFELEGRWPWLALVSLRLVFAMVCVPDYLRTSAGFGRSHIDTV